MLWKEIVIPAVFATAYLVYVSKWVRRAWRQRREAIEIVHLEEQFEMDDYEK